MKTFLNETKPAIPETSIEKFLLNFLRKHGAYLVTDLAQCEKQVLQTTKHGRREKALAYMLDAVSGMRADACTLPDEQECIEWINACETLKAMSKSPEVQTSYDRTIKRLSWQLTYLDNYANGKVGPGCKGCGMPIKQGESCDCDNRRGRAKDAAMARDDTVQETK